MGRSFKKKKELLYIKDFTNAVKCALETGVEGIFNLSGDRPYTLEEQIDGIIETFNSPKCKSEKSIYRINPIPHKIY